MKEFPIEKIHEFFLLSGLLEKKAKFTCHSDSMFTYEFIDNKGTHEISVIDLDRSYLEKESVLDLLTSKSLGYLSYRLFESDKVVISFHFKNEIKQDLEIHDEETILIPEHLKESYNKMIQKLIDDSKK